MKNIAIINRNSFARQALMFISKNRSKNILDYSDIAYGLTELRNKQIDILCIDRLPLSVNDHNNFLFIKAINPEIKILALLSQIELNFFERSALSIDYALPENTSVPDITNIFSNLSTNNNKNPPSFILPSISFKDKSVCKITLNHKETYILKMLLDGSDYIEIARSMRIDNKMVSRYKRSAMRKLQARNLPELISAVRTSPINILE